MTDREFDELLTQNITDPPSEIANTVTPWRKSINRVLWGLAFCSLTLKFLNLDTILPAIGTVLMLLGFRALRKENGWFRLSYWIAIVQTICFLARLFVSSTVYRENAQASIVFLAMSVLSLLLNLAHYVLLLGGIEEVQQKAGMHARTDGILFTILCYVLLLILALGGLNLGLFAIIAYICIFLGLYRLSKKLDEAGYTITPAPVKCSDQAVTIGFAATAGVLIAIGLLFFCQYPMDWQSAQPTEMRQELLDLGMPEQVLRDLTEEDILQCESAAEIVTDTTMYDELKFTTVSIRLEDESWKIIHHFQWVENPGFRGTECLTLRPIQTVSWVEDVDVSGRLLYDRDGSTYTAPYHSISTGSHENIYAAFSLPSSGESQRGYLMYEVLAPSIDTWANSWCSYTHQTKLLQFPAQTAMEFDTTSSNNGWAFRTVDDIIELLIPGK